MSVEGMYARAIITAILSDLESRNGLHISSLDQETQTEIRKSWYKSIVSVLKERHGFHGNST